PARAEERRRRVRRAGQEDREEGKAARRFPAHRVDAARRDAGAPGLEVHGRGVESDRRAEGRDPARRRRGEAGFRAVRPLAEVPREAAALLSVPDQVAGDGEGRRYREGREEARRRISNAARRRDVREERGEGRERDHRGEGAAGDEEERAGEAAERF